MSHLDLFCNRVRQALEVIQTMAQLNKLSKSIVGIPRPKREELIIEEVQEPFYKQRKPKEPLIEVQEKEEKTTLELDDIQNQEADTDQSLQAIVEGDELAKSEILEEEPEVPVHETVDRKPIKFSVESDENKKKPLTEEELSILKLHYPDCDSTEHDDIEGPNVSTIVEQCMDNMNAAMKHYVNTKTLLDVESKDKEKFDVCFNTFQSEVQSLEKFIAAYLHVIFMRKLTTQQGLDILTKFAPIASRTGLKGIISEKYVEIFSVYEKDLDEVQITYEKYKTKPILMRNAPPVAGAIFWSRQLLKRIEDPMRIFRDIKAVTSLADYGSQVRTYNKLATALVTFESLWFTQWKNNIEQARSGLKATLFVLHPVTGDIIVNADERILELIHEAKWMTRLDIQIPESAFSVVMQEARFKGYKSHLELVLSDFRVVCQDIPSPLMKLFRPHILNVQQQLQPGLNSLAWNSMNIDAFLHQVHLALDKLKSLNDRVHQVLKDQVFAMISHIDNLFLFDLDTAFSQIWHVEEFTATIRESIKERSALLKQYVDTIVDGLQSIANFLTAKKHKRKQQETKFPLKDKKLQLMLSETDHEKERQEAASEQANVLEFITHFKEQVFKAVLAVTTKTLACLADAAGCTGEVIRAFTPTSNVDSESDFSSPSPRPHQGHYFSPDASRGVSAQSGGRQSQVSNRPASNVTNLSELTWTHGLSPDTKTLLQFEVEVKFSIPNIIVEPTLDIVQKAITDAANAILEANNDIFWMNESNSTSFSNRVKTDSNVQDLFAQLTTVIEDLDRPVSQHLLHFSYYNFLWKDDMHGNFNEFISAAPGTIAIKREVERYVSLEKKVLSIPGILPVGPISLFSDPIKDSLHGFSIAWKTKFASVVHEEAKKNLDSAVLYRSNVRSKLEQHVQTLDQLNSVLRLLEELRDMENKIDGIYLPIELMYSKLREFELRLPRDEVEEVDSLRDKWAELLELADNVRNVLLKERRGAFEQELDKQVKTFVVEVIQFRNAFDAQGPSVPGIQPSEAVSRLHDFQHRYRVYDDKRKTLDSVSKLFSIACKPFPELDKTGEELDLLSQLYGLFQKFIRFDNKFRETLWADVDLEGSSVEVEGYWDECLALPSKLKDWDAYNDLKAKLQMYLEVFPLLQKLASKGHNRFNLNEIRNRHWLEVMHVTHSSFQLEANIFKLCHLLDIGLIKHKAEVEEICKGASRELELEIKMRLTEEEWTEQVLNFQHYKKRGPMYLDKAFTERLLEQLEDAEALLATMLTSRYIGPLRDEAASWAEKLKEVAEVLELWLEVQDLWQYLEAVFSNSLAVRELPQEAKRFARIDKGWTKMMKRAFDTRNVLQCCYGGEVPKAVVLRHIHEELEICFKSLVGYLDNKRRAFPRFYFVSDPILLAVLSHPNDLESVKPHLKSFFSAISDVKLEKADDRDLEDSDHDTETRSVQHHRTRRTHAHGGSPRDRGSSTLSALTRSTTPPKIDKRLHQVYNINPNVMQHVPSMLPSEGLVDDILMMDATAVLSADGEMLHLANKVSITEGVEVWISKLRDSVGDTLHRLNQAIITDCKNGIGLEEWPLKYPSQVCRTGMLYHWTAECELAIADIKYDRKALQLALRKYTMATSKLATVLQRGSWRLPDKSMKTKHRVRLEAMITQSTYLKDILENMCHRKLRETTDFEWRRSLRCYLQPDPTLALQQPVPSASTDRSRQTTPELEPSIEEGGESKPVPRIWILDSHYEYGTEFYGTDPGVSPTPVTEKCFLTMSLALKQIMGSLLVGPGGVGKTETIKGLANILGNFLGLFPLSKDQEPVSLGKIIQGLAMDGCWGCLKESQTLNQFALSVLLDYVQSVFAALKAKQTYMNLGDGSEIPLRNSVGIFLSMDMSIVPNMKLPSDITEAFRVISMLQPDTAMLLRARCAAMGFKAPNVLANRLKLLTELVKDQLPPDAQHNFSVPALIGILKRASQKRKKDKDDKLAEKNNLKDDMSRSESQNSDPLTSRINQSGALNKASLMSLRKSGTVNALTLPAKQEHAMVCDIIEEIIAPRLMTENQALFKNILKDCFAGLPNSEGQGGKSAGKIRQLGSGKPGTLLKLDTNAHELEPFLEQKAVDAGLIPHKPLIAKCEQLYLLSQIYNGVIVAGPPGTGKSTCIQLMVDALCARNLSISDSSSSMHKLLSINPLVVDNTALMFGYLGSNNEWVDSIFTHAIRKSNRNISTTWICLNGNLNESWADNLNSFLAGERVLPLKNGDKLFLSENIMLLFETDDLALASPATVSSCGILYLDKDIVSWQPIVKSWLDTRSQLEVHVLQRAFQKTLDPVINFVFSETKPSLQLSEVGMLHSCLALLSAMLADNIEVSGELHIERLYLFCLIWTFGGLLDISDRKPFSDLLTTLSTALPDDDRDISVFDYYVDESGEWDPWHSKMSEASSTDNQDFLGEVFVDTIDIIRIRLLMEFSASSGRNVLLVGPHGSGKTSIINEYINSQDPQLSVCKRLVFSGASTARQLQEFIESNIHHRQGFVYGAKENKKLKVFIDDLNLPLPDKSGTQRCNELLRQLLDEKQLFTTEKPFEWHKVEGLSVMSAMVLNNFPSAQNRSVSQRLLRHFSVFYVPVPQGDSLKSIVDGILKGNMTKGNGAELEHDLHNILVSASCEMLTSLQNVLHQSPMEGRYHYLFTLKDITKCFQCLRRLAEESKADDIMVVSLWRHELVRIVRDGISRMADLHWLDEKITAVLNETWKKDLTSLHENFVTFPVDTRVYQRPLTSVAGTNQVKVSLQPVVKWSDLHSCINTHLTRYNDEFGNIRLNTMLSDLVISHVVRIHRVLSFHHGGNMLLIGAIGSKLSTLCRLALHVADIPIHKIDTSKQSNFFDGLRSAIRLSGSEGKVIGLLFTARDLEDPIYMDAINSLLVSGEYPHLFSNDEMEGLLLAIQPAMKRETSSSSVDPMKFFVSKVKCNLHLLICLHPGHDLLRTAAKNYPGLLTGCQVNWLCDWPQETLLNEASYFISKYQLTEDFEDLRESITTSLANIHSFVLRDCKQIPWAGDVNATVNMTSFKVNEKKKDQLKFSLATVPNLPYSKVILHERIRFNHRDRSKSKNEVYVGPTTYRKFMETFKYLYLWKSGERTKAVEQLKKVISTLDKTRLDAKVMKKGIKTLNEKFEGAQTNTAELLNKLTAKVTALEKLKAKIGLSKSLDAYLQLNEMDVGEVEEEDFFKEEEYDAYDAEFDRMREANLKTRQVQAKDELETQKSQVEQCRANLAYAKQQVIFWRNKVDRGVIEHVRAFSNPPLLVGQIIEMVMVLIGKRLPSQRLVEVKDGTSKMEMSSRMSTSSSGTKTLVKKTPKSKEPGDKFDKTQWKSMQQTMSDSVKFVDMLHNLSWEDGLPSDVLAAVESYLACSKEGQLGVTGEGSLLENAQEKQFQAVKQRSPSPGARTGLTIAGAKYASEDCATLVHYTIAIVEYSRLCGPLKSSIERMHELEREIEENERQQKLQEQEKNPIFKVKAKEAEKPQEQEEDEEEELSEADLPRMQSELSELQALFDRAVVEKHSLEMELQSMNERLKSAVDFIESLKSQESKWRQEVQDNDGNELMLANCITAAATLTYCGPVNIDTRRRMGEFFMQVCEHHGVPLHKQMLFRNIELVDFLYTPLDNIALQRLQLPTTRLMLENACFLIQDASMTAWPLICDPTSRAIDWLRLYFTGKQFVEVKYHEVRSQLENCLADGTPLLVTDCDLQSLVKDKRFINTIQTCSSFINGKSRFKVIVTDHEVECDPKFRMFLHTTSEPHVCPSELAACTSVTFFQQSRADVEEELLDIFMAQEKSRLNNELTTLRQEKQENMEMSEKIECQMKDQLSSDVRLMNDLLATKKLSELRKQFEETQESQSRVLTAEDSIYKARESYRQIAQRAAVCFDTTQYLREINGLYQSSFKQFVTVYQTAIAHSERSSMKAVIDRLTYSSFLTAARGLLERDRVVFALLLAIEVEDSLGNVGPGEREFVISPNFSSVVMSAMGSNNTDSHIMQVKKSFDWMTDDQFHNLQILATHFDWFRDMFDRMPKDGRETQWRNLCESDLPENVPLPDRMDDVLKAIHRLCIVRAVRNDRLLQASSNFVSTVLGKKYITDISLDLPTVLRQSSFTLPILLLFRTEAELTLRVFQEFAVKKQTKFLTIVLTDNLSDERSVKKQIHRGMTEGLWVLLHNAHNSPRLLNSLESILNEGTDPSDSNFRLWVSSHVDTNNIPVRFLQNSLRLFVDSPKVMKDCLSRSLTWMEPDILRQSNRPDWPAMLHNLCYLHAAVHLRTRFGGGGWNLPHEFSQIGFRELQEAVRFTVGEFKDLLFVMAADGTMVPRTTSWTGIRFMLSEIVYGTHTTDVYDQQALSAIVEYWCTPNAVKKDFEVARLKYRAPAAFFNTNVRLNTLIQSIDSISQYFLEVPEACHLHPNIELSWTHTGNLTLLGDDQYVFTRLNKIFDAMPVSPTLSHKLFPRPPTPFAARASTKFNEIEEEFVPNSGPPIAGISSQSNNPLVVDQGVFSTASYATYKTRKDMELWEVCHTLLQKVPKAYNKEYILEKVKKVGGFTAFNNFIMKELETMYKLLNDIRTCLQAIKNATESETLGDQVSQHILEVADDIYHLRIPEAWCKMSGYSAPPLTFGIAQWLVELQNRCYHFEKILSLGRDKMPSYWLGAFFNPRGLLSLVKQDSIRSYANERQGNFELLTLQTEITSRDKDHLRDPPQDGIFVWGIYLWGCGWDKTTGELQDLPPRSGCASLPVVHVTCWPVNEKPILQDSVRASETYQCPVYHSRLARQEVVLEMDVRREGIPASRWPLRGLTATIRPY
ncbi:dynein axonemal heavy chain 8-like isoform X3 [Biomphalaria glabrata]|uniref:Dynein axonemal heavy chain 8-like isoform X3 n=1 Tax=Biomphalaria glabrata TaxID=6526 RepID=A0A9W3AQC9_BIOGL|nr:dynein axonemal heavy chain 8-like isoform X3 [Biomphalaria glabrata]